MSNYTILTAKKRTESNIRTIDLPTDPKPSPVSDAKNGTLLISLLQSRLNWCHSIFPKYRHDAVQQPRRTNNMRKKWPNMRYLGVCTVHLGAHVFPETTFYEAVRKEPWAQLAKEAGLAEEITDISNDNSNSNNNNESAQQQQQEEEEQCDHDRADNKNDMKQQQQQQQQQPRPQPPGAHRDLVFTDLIMEFKENAGERFIFPKEAIVEVASDQRPSQLTASFLLPVTDHQDFFRDASEKVALWGHQSPSETIRNYATTLDQPMEEIDENNTVKQEGGEDGERMTATTKSITQQPVNMRLSPVDEPLLHMILSTVQSAETVREKMMIRLKTLPTRTYLQYHSTMNKTIMELLQKAFTIPDVVHGPVTAEKRRNELLNAIHLGKRPRSDEELLPKSKSAHIKDDGLRKCAYCSAKTTSMWRQGPAGQGTLCNSCGLMWSQRKILKDAPVCSKEEEKRRAKEERERRRDEEAMEKENERQKQLLELEQQKQKQEEKQQQQQSTNNRKGSTQGKSTMRHATQVSSSSQQGSVEHQQEQTKQPKKQKQKQKQKQVKQKQQEQQQQTVSVPPPIAAASAPATAPLPPNNTSTPVSASSASTTTVVKAEPKPSLYHNPHGIPLPTLSIDFGPSFLFVHPACSVILVENCFSIRLVKEGFPSVSMMIDKTQLKYAKFEVIEEKQLKREVLTMTVIPEEGPVLHQFNTDLLVPGDSTKHMKIRFLEKLDTGGAVVQRILERWLSTPSVMPSSNSNKSIIEPSASSIGSSSTSSSSRP